MIHALPLLLMMSLIFTASQIPGHQFALPTFPQMDKVVHLGIYGMLALSFLYWRAKQPGRLSRRTYVFTIVFCLLYGISDELHQSFIPYRDASLADLAADGLGSMLAVGWWRRWWEGGLQ